MAGLVALTPTGCGRSSEEREVVASAVQGLSSPPSVAQPALVAPEVAGILPGGGHVSGGDYTYSIPIVVPSGRAGMQPSVSLQYSSSGGEGALGLGWSVSAGTSAITRCGRTQGVGKETDFVRFDTSDYYCLDGARLLGTLGTYGALNSEYRTEIDRFAKVVLKELAANNEPTKFEVYFKDGRIGTFERQSPLLDRTVRDAAGAVTSTTQVALMWPMTKLVDRAGNRISYSYAPSSSTGKSVPIPLAIEYALCDAGTCGYPNARKRKVAFVYEVAPRPREGYMNGVAIRHTARIGKIRTSVFNTGNTAETVSREYRLRYSAALGSGRDLLRGVSQCDGAATPVCMPETTFTWREADRASYTNATGIQSTLVSLVPIAQRYQLAPENSIGLVDVDNDGNDDVLLKHWSPPQTLTLSNQNQQASDRLYRGNGNSYFSTTAETIDVSGTGTPKAGCTGREGLDYASAQPVDMNGDGRIELVVATNDACPFINPNGAGFIRVQPGHSANVALNLQQRKYALLGWGSVSGTQKLTASNVSTAAPLASTWGTHELRFADLNGDGRPELIDGFSDGGLWVWAVRFAGQSPDPYAAQTYSFPLRAPLAFDSQVYKPRGLHRTTDENGDGRQELVSIDYQGTQRAFYLRSNLTDASTQDLIATRRIVKLPQSVAGWQTNPAAPGVPGWGTPDFSDSASFTADASYWYGVDINGDGLKDALYATNLAGGGGTGLWRIRINTGNGYLAEATPGAVVTTLNTYPTDTALVDGVVRKGLDNGIRIADMNGDGLEDLILLDPGSNFSTLAGSLYSGTSVRPRVAFSNGTGFDAPVEIGPSLGATTLRIFRRQEFFMARLGDVNGDGKPELVDLMTVPSDQSKRQPVVWKSSSGTEVITSVSDERGEAERITYDTLSAGSASRGVNDLGDSSDTHVSDARLGASSRACVYPARCVGTGTVVAKYESFRSSREIKNVYRYFGARVDATGRGSLGFAQTKVIDLVGGFETLATFDQTPFNPSANYHFYPRVAVPTKVETGRYRGAGYTVPSDIVNFAAADPSPKTTVDHQITFGTTLPLRASSLVSTKKVFEETTATTPGPQRYEYQTTRTLDSFGNVTQTDAYSRGLNASPPNTESSTTEVVQYSNTASNWLVGLPTKVTSTTRTKDDAFGTGCTTNPCSEKTAVIDIEYDADGVARGFPWKVHREQALADSTGRRSTTEFGRDSSGLVTSVKRTAFGTGAPPARTETTAYDDSGVNVKEITNSAGHKTWLLYYTFGDGNWLYGLADQNGAADKVDVLVTRDTLGRERQIREDKGTNTFTTLSYGTGVLRVNVNAEVERATFFDTRNRPTLDTWTSFSGTGAVSETLYHRLGGVQKTRYIGTALTHATLSASEASARNAFGGTSGGNQTSAATYDRMGRRRTATNGTSEVSSFGYPSPLGKSSFSDPSGNYGETFDDQNGRQRTLMQRLAGTTPRDIVTRYGYDDRGQIGHIKTADGAREAYTYDNLGRFLERRQYTVAGTSYSMDRRVEYNSFDEVIREHHGGGTTGDISVQYTRDIIGRVTERKHTNPTGGEEERQVFTWDSATQIGKLISAQTYVGVPAQQIPGQPGVTTTYSYDTLGRMNGFDQRFPDSASAPTSLGVRWTFDTRGRLDTMTYPERTGDVIQTPSHPSTGGLTIKYGYKNGKIESIRDNALPTTSPAIWLAQTRDEFGGVKTATNSDGLNATWVRDLNTGRLTSHTVTTSTGTSIHDQAFQYFPNGLLKKRTTATRPENFVYDTLRRLTNYDRNAALTADRVVASYAYDDVGNISGVTTASSNSADWPNVNESYSYTSTTIPNFLTSQTIGAATKTYLPDAAGRLATQQAGSVVERSLTYTSFDLPKEISAGGNTTKFLYDSDNRRVRKTTTKADGSVDDVISVSKLYEQRTTKTPTGAITGESIFRIDGENGPLAEIRQGWTPTALVGARTTRFLHNDHQGSPTTISRGTTIEDSSGFFPFGKKQQIGATVAPRRGYTGHDHDDELGLIDMNGRVYDVAQRRFLTRDPILSPIGHAGAYNPYAYVLNNPTNLTDPTGLLFGIGGFDPFGWLKGGGGSGQAQQEVVEGAVVTAAPALIGVGGVIAAPELAPVIVAGAIVGIYFGDALLDAATDGGGGSQADNHGNYVPPNTGAGSAPSGSPNTGGGRGAGGDNGAEGSSGPGSGSSPSSTPAPAAPAAAPPARNPSRGSAPRPRDPLPAPPEVVSPPQREGQYGPPEPGQVTMPMSPPGTSVDQNIQKAVSSGFLMRNILGQMAWFYLKVHGGGPWDYKLLGDPLYEDFGNFNYGATGAAMGIPLEVLLREAGRAQINSGTSRPEWNAPPETPLWRWGGEAPYGDDPNDQRWIHLGYRYYMEVYGGH